MKHIKTYEKTIFYTRDKNKKFEVGDKVFVIYDTTYADPFKKFLPNNIGVIYSLYKSLIGNKYTIQYKDIPKDVKDFMSRDNKNKRTLITYVDETSLKLATPNEILEYEMLKNADKYNL